MDDGMGGLCSAHESNEKCVQNLVGKLERKRPLGRPKQVWEDNMRMGRCGLDASG